MLPVSYLCVLSNNISQKIMFLAMAVGTCVDPYINFSPGCVQVCLFENILNAHSSSSHQVLITQPIFNSLKTNFFWGLASGI
jgi:hypothetical protein